MAIKIFELNSASEQTNITTILEETGISMKITNATLVNGAYTSVNVKFPNMSEYNTVSNVYRLDYSQRIVVADTENYFLAVIPITNQTDMEFIYNSKLYYFLETLIYRSEVKGNVLAGMYGYKIVGDLINIPSYRAYSGADEDIITCPLFYANEIYDRGFIPNCYINYQRKFPAGTRLRDTNGNEFISLGNYFLYKEP